MTYTKRKFPHIYPPGAVFFITWRLADSLPQSVINSLKVEYDEEISKIKVIDKSLREGMRIKLRKKIFGKFDHQLDRFPYGNCVLNDEALAEVVSQKILQYDAQYYNTLCFAIMPNHVHVLLDTSIQLTEMCDFDNPPEGYVQVNKWMQYIKGGSARKINLLRNKTGKLWATESFDYYMRNEASQYRIHRYILNNPKKAGLPARFRKPPYLFSKDQYPSGC